MRTFADDQVEGDPYLFGRHSDEDNHVRKLDDRYANAAVDEIYNEFVEIPLRSVEGKSGC